MENYELKTGEWDFWASVVEELFPYAPPLSLSLSLSRGSAAHSDVLFEAAVWSSVLIGNRSGGKRAISEESATEEVATTDLREILASALMENFSDPEIM